LSLSYSAWRSGFVTLLSKEYLTMKWHKQLSGADLAGCGKKVGETTEFSSRYLANIHIR